MFEFGSRYYAIETAIHILADGREIPYKRRRFLPQGETLPLLVEVLVSQGDRLDLVTARTLGVPDAFWQVADANNAMNPFDLTGESGRRLRVALPQPSVPQQ
jgi:hypothetical protein